MDALEVVTLVTIADKPDELTLHWRIVEDIELDMMPSVTTDSEGSRGNDHRRDHYCPPNTAA